MSLAEDVSGEPSIDLGHVVITPVQIYKEKRSRSKINTKYTIEEKKNPRKFNVLCWSGLISFEIRVSKLKAFPSCIQCCMRPLGSDDVTRSSSMRKEFSWIPILPLFD